MGGVSDRARQGRGGASAGLDAGRRGRARRAGSHQAGGDTHQSVPPQMSTLGGARGAQLDAGGVERADVPRPHRWACSGLVAAGEVWLDIVAPPQRASVALGHCERAGV